MEYKTAADFANSFSKMVANIRPESFEGAAHLGDIELLVNDVYQLGLIERSDWIRLIRIIEQKFVDYKWERKLK